MREILAEILDLQPHWTSIKNDAMARRGELVRHAGPDWLRQFSADLANAIGIPIEDLGLEGRDGTGPKTEVPWFRFYSKERSPSATIGWYCVYLFDTDGHRAFLTLGHGSTDWTGVDFKPRPHAELAALADWAREKVSHRVGPERTRFGFFIKRCYLEGRGKVELARHNDGNDDLGDERTYLSRTIPQGVYRNLRQGTTEPDINKLRRAGAIVGGVELVG